MKAQEVEEIASVDLDTGNSFFLTSYRVFSSSTLIILSHFSKITALLQHLFNEVYTTLEVLDLAATATICN